MAYPFNGYTIVLDVGHGNKTFPPSKGVYKDGKGYAEHDFNSKLAVAVQELLEFNGFKTIMYQKPFSSEVSLVKRTNHYNRLDIDLVWSIHANAGNKTADGRCAFYWHTNSSTRKLAQMFAEEVKNAGYNTHGDGTHASMVGSWTNMHIIRESKADAILTENGFMTNDLPGINDDFELVFGSKQDEYIYDMARVHAKSISRHFGLKFRDFEDEPKVSPAPNTKTKPSQVKSQKYYRVRSSWKNAKSQKGAFLKLSGAKDVADKHGYNVYDWNGKSVYVGNSKPKGRTKVILPNATYWVKSPLFSGSGVRAVQEALASVYFYPDKGAKNNGIDGYYGVKTADAVKRFQSVHGLKTDGDYGPATRAKLLQVMK